MASVLDYFTPGQMPAAQADQNIMPGIAAFMNDPKALSALLAFGTQAMIPQWGGGGVQFAKGVGAAGEALDKQQQDELRKQEADSKAALRESQAGLAEARSTAAGARTGAAADRLALETFRQGEISKRNELGRKVALSNMYQKYISDVAKRNNDPLRPAGSAPEQILPMPQWIQSNPMLKNLGLAPGSDQPITGDEELPPTATLDSASVPPVASGAGMPQNPVVGKVYPSPKGPMKYLGNDRWGPP